jgi:hypothetical protein
MEPKKEDIGEQIISKLKELEQALNDLIKRLKDEKES